MIGIPEKFNKRGLLFSLTFSDNRCMKFNKIETIKDAEVKKLAKRKANHVRPGMNAAKAQGKGAGYNEEFSIEPLTEAQKQNNKKRKKNQ